MAKSKEFKLPPEDHFPQAEFDQLYLLKFQHRDRIAAISQVLYEDDVKFSDKGAIAKEESRIEEEEFLRKLKENENVNAKVAKDRTVRLEKEMKEQEQDILRQVDEFEKQKLKEESDLEDFIRSETVAIENRIRLEDLEKAIEKALDNPIDYEYAIDKDGYIYHGRETKSNQVPKEERVKILQPQTESEILLQSKNVEN